MPGNYAFRPGFFLSLTMIVLVGLFVKLGFWQLSRGEQKLLLKQTIESRTMQQPLLINGLMTAGPELPYRNVIVRGVFRNDLQIFLDGKKHNGRYGYHVITPLQIEGGEILVLVNRGWVEADYDRSNLPKVSAPEGVVEIRGSIEFPVIPPFVSRPSSHPEPMWDNRWPFIDLDYFASLNNVLLQPFVILQNPLAEYGFIREWPKFDPKSDMHRGYAIQWFAFAVITIGIYFGLSLSKRK
jgi:surfeit locus 1 family protein